MLRRKPAEAAPAGAQPEDSEDFSEAASRLRPGAPISVDADPENSLVDSIPTKTSRNSTATESSRDRLARRRGNRPSTFDSFRDPDFRWFYLAMLGQMAAMNMQLVVRGLLAYDLTGSYAALGLVGLFGALPMLTLSMFGGVLADRMPKKTVLQAGQFLSLLNAAFMSTLVFTDVIAMPWLYVSALAQGSVMALMMPSRQAMLPDIVGMDRLMNAVSLNMAGMNSMQLISPAAGGFIVSFAGFEYAFLAMAILYAVALSGLSRLTWRPAAVAAEEGMSILGVAKKSLEDIRGGLRYIRANRTILLLLSLSFVTSVFAMPHTFLLPGYVADIFGGGGSKLGLLISLSAVGSLAAMISLAAVPNRHRGKLLLASMIVLGLGVLIFAQISEYWLAAPIMLAIGVGSALRQALMQGLLQEYTEREYLGRVMSVFMMQFSVMQLGTFIVGVIAEAAGVQSAFMGLGIGLIVITALVYTFAPRLRNLK